MANAEISQVLSVERDRFFDVITQYEEYPSFVDGCQKVEIESRESGRTTVIYSISLIKEISYKLEHIEDRDAGKMSWSLVESEFLKSNQGFWQLEAVEGGTRVTYSIDIDFRIPVPGLILRKLVKGSLPNMLKNFERKALGG